MTQTPPESPLRIGVVGCGGSRLSYGPALAAIPSARVTAVMDPDSVSTRVWIRQSGTCRAFSDFGEFLDDAPVDAVVLASPLEARSAQALALIDRGLPLLSDVPFAASATESAAIAARAVARGVVLMPALALRFDDVILETRQKLLMGMIGSPRELRSEWEFYEGWSHRKRALGTWPGVLSLHAIRTIDLAGWLMGSVISVSADIDAEAGSVAGACFANIIMQHVMGTSVHHVSRSSRRSRRERFVLTGTDGAFEINGPAASALDGTGMTEAVLRRLGTEETLEQPDTPEIGSALLRVPVRRPYRSLVAHFIDVVLGGALPSVQAREAVDAQSLLECALLSSREGVKVAPRRPALTAIAP